MDKQALERELERRMTQINRRIGSSVTCPVQPLVRVPLQRRESQEGALQAHVVYLLIPTSNHNVKAFTKQIDIVVYLLIPTSNHNAKCVQYRISYVVYLLIPTSNHNNVQESEAWFVVVYLLIPTSNHNASEMEAKLFELYIF